MKQPSIDYLLKKVDSKYVLAVAAAKRARVLTEIRNSGDNSKEMKPVITALWEIADDELVIEKPQRHKKIK